MIASKWTSLNYDEESVNKAENFEYTKVLKWLKYTLREPEKQLEMRISLISVVWKKLWRRNAIVSIEQARLTFYNIFTSD